MKTRHDHPSTKILHSYFEGELSRADSHPVAEHLDHCETCRDTLGMFRGLRKSVRDAGNIRLSGEFAKHTVAVVRMRYQTEEEWSIIEKTAEKIFVGLAILVLLLMTFGPTNGDVPGESQVQRPGVFNEYLSDTTVVRLVASGQLSKDDVLAAALHRP